MKYISTIKKMVFPVCIVLIISLLVFTKRFYIRTGSMEPDYLVGTMVFIVQDDDLEVGDVAAYRQGQNIVIHRVVAVVEDGYQFKGDNNPTPDGSIISKESIVGRELFKISVIAPMARKLGLGGIQIAN